MNLRPLLYLIVIGLLPVLFAVPVSANEKQDQQRPNILLITADNLGYGDLGCYGNPDIKTPQLDRLAQQGVRLTDFYTASPTCTVSRATLTGRYPQRIGLNHQLRADENYGDGLRQTELLIPQYLKPQGYRTACFGKWNIGFSQGSRPTERGFDEFFEVRCWKYRLLPSLLRQTTDLWRGFERGLCKRLFNGSIRRCRLSVHCCRINNNPFFIYLPFNAPHFPRYTKQADQSTK